MTWLRLDDGFPDHPKVGGLSDKAFRLHVSALCYSARHLTDGFIPADRPPLLVHRLKPAVIDELVRRGAWEPAVDGWRLHDFLDFNPSAAKVKEDRQAAADRMARSRERSAQQKANGKRSSSAHGSSAPARPEGTRAGGLPDSVGGEPPSPTPDGGDGSLMSKERLIEATRAARAGLECKGRRSA
jgi:hypothetical protein